MNTVHTKMKITFTGQYAIAPYPSNAEVEITLCVQLGEKTGTIMIHDKDINKIIVRDFNPRYMTVHKSFFLSNGSTIHTAEAVRNQRVNNPNVNYGPTTSQNSKEVISQIYERDLIVPSGTFEKILQAFNIFPDPVELLFDA